MITSACVLLAVTSLASSGPSLYNIPIINDPNDPPPLCPLTPAEDAELQKLVYRDHDADAALIQPFTELWSSRFAQKKLPFCMKTYVTRTVESQMLKQISVVKNTQTNDQEEVITYLQKIEKNVFLVRSAGDDRKPIARIYLIYVNTNALVLFQCSLEPAPLSKLLFSKFYRKHISTDVPSLPENIPLPKVAILSVPQLSIPYMKSIANVLTAINTAREIIAKNGNLFGHTVKTDPCMYTDGDIEKGQF